MTSLRSPLSRPGSAAAALAIALAAMAPLQVGLVLTRRGEPAPIAVPTPAETPSGTLVPPVDVTPTPEPAETGPQHVGARLAAFVGLGTWVDVYDYVLDPSDAVTDMKARGARTLYLQTGRFRDSFDVKPGAGQWLVAAHRAGLRVVGWYVPSYRDLSRDVRRALAGARFRFGGERFDAFAIDFEFKDEVPDNATWNARAVTHVKRVRAALGRSYPLAAITSTPLGMTVQPSRWTGFPWTELDAEVDAFVLMSYWSFRTDCPANPEHCPYEYSLGNVERLRQILEDAEKPVHLVGGVADQVTAAGVSEFTRAVRDARIAGASMYDYRTTSSRIWSILSGLGSFFV